MQRENKQQLQEKKGTNKRPLQKGDFEAVLKAATKPLKKEQGEKHEEATSEKLKYLCKLLVPCGVEWRIGKRLVISLG